MLSNVIRIFEQKRIEKNYNKLLQKMVNYHQIVHPYDSHLQHLIEAAVDIEMAKNRGCVNEKYELVGIAA